MKKPKPILIPGEKGFDSGLVRLELTLFRSTQKSRTRLTSPAEPIGRTGAAVRPGVDRLYPKPEPKTENPNPHSPPNRAGRDGV